MSSTPPPPISSASVRNILTLLISRDAQLVAGVGGLEHRVTWACRMRARLPAFESVHGGELALLSLPQLRRLDETLPHLLKSLHKEGVYHCRPVTFTTDLTSTRGATPRNRTRSNHLRRRLPQRDRAQGQRYLPPVDAIECAGGRREGRLRTPRPQLRQVGHCAGCRTANPLQGGSTRSDRRGCAIIHTFPYRRGTAKTGTGTGNSSYPDTPRSGRLPVADRKRRF